MVCGYFKNENASLKTFFKFQKNIFCSNLYNKQKRIKDCSMVSCVCILTNTGSNPTHVTEKQSNDI